MIIWDDEEGATGHTGADKLRKDLLHPWSCRWSDIMNGDDESALHAISVAGSGKWTRRNSRRAGCRRPLQEARVREWNERALSIKLATALRRAKRLQAANQLKLCFA